MQYCAQFPAFSHEKEIRGTVANNVFILTFRSCFIRLKEMGFRSIALIMIQSFDLSYMWLEKCEDCLLLITKAALAHALATVVL